MAANKGHERAAWRALAVLVLLYTVSLIDRSILSMLVGDIRRDLHLGDFQLSLLLGPAFGIAYVAFGVPFGWLADKWPRPLVMFIGMTIWSLACAGGGLANGFLLLFLSRSLVGAGEASMAPCSYSLLGELLPPGKFTLAMAIFGYGGSVGGALALLVGGYITTVSAQLSASGLPVLSVFQPWQLALLIVGLAGLPMAFLAFTLTEPRGHTHARPGSAPPIANIGPFVKRNALLIGSHFLAFGLCMMVVYSTASWNPQHLSRAFGWSQVRIGSSLAVMALAGPLVGQISAVHLVRWFGARGSANPPFKAFLCHVAVALPAQLGYLTGSPELCLLAIFLIYAATSPLMTFGASALNLYTPLMLRGRMSGAFVAFVSLCGLGLGPALVGFVAQYGFRSDSYLGTSLALVNGACLLGVMVCLWLAFRQSAPDEAGATVAIASA